MELLLQEYAADRTFEGAPPAGAFTGSAGGSACGDLARISLLPDPDFDPDRPDAGNRRITAVTFAAEGCAPTRAACALVCELVEGETLLEAARIGTDRIDEELGGLGPAHRHAAVLASDALHRALSKVASSGIALAATATDRVMVAVSGGVDSAVATLLQQEQGADVVAVTVKLWADPKTDGTKACCSPEAVLGARAVSHGLGVPHFTLDLQETFRERVVDPFLDGYADGLTPNPCILCNGEVRISAMVALGLRAGAGRLVTGHYARVVDDGEGALIAAADDPRKDQSYMLAALPPAVIARLEFPLAGMTKPEVREIAARHDLTVAGKPESQDLCFLAGRRKQDFLRDEADLEDRPGLIRSSDGRDLGEHHGFHNFTVGQRRGLGVAATEPLYVLGTDPAENVVTVGTREQLAVDRVGLTNVTLHRDGSRVDRVRLRYHTDPVPVRIPAGRGRHDRVELELGRPFEAPAPGQTAVLLDGDLVVGHGTITSAG